MEAMWYTTKMPPELVSLVETDLRQFDSSLQTAITTGGVNLSVRDSKTTWINTTHWVAGLCYHYVLLANRQNFLYDIDGFDGETMQYTSYSPGEYYGWHQDTGLGSMSVPGEDAQEVFLMKNCERVRKLSFIMQLSNPDEYSGGEVQLMRDTGKTFFLPKERGTIIVFDSRTRHRAKAVKSGTRKSLVGWVSGPRWK
jgi:PKHD-type hydroxylase